MQFPGILSSTMWTMIEQEVYRRLKSDMLPNKETLFSHDFLELFKNAFIEKRKIIQQQLCQFS